MKPPRRVIPILITHAAESRSTSTEDYGGAMFAVTFGEVHMNIPLGGKLGGPTSSTVDNKGFL